MFLSSEETAYLPPVHNIDSTMTSAGVAADAKGPKKQPRPSKPATQKSKFPASHDAQELSSRAVHPEKTEHMSLTSLKSALDELGPKLEQSPQWRTEQLMEHMDRLFQIQTLFGLHLSELQRARSSQRGSKGEPGGFDQALELQRASFLELFLRKKMGEASADPVLTVDAPHLLQLAARRRPSLSPLGSIREGGSSKEDDEVSSVFKSFDRVSGRAEGLVEAISLKGDEGREALRLWLEGGGDKDKEKEALESLQALSSRMEHLADIAVSRLLEEFREALVKNTKVLDALGLKQELEKRVAVWNNTPSSPIRAPGAPGPATGDADCANPEQQGQPDLVPRQLSGLCLERSSTDAPPRRYGSPGKSTTWEQHTAPGKERLLSESLLAGATRRSEEASLSPGRGVPLGPTFVEPAQQQQQRMEGFMSRDSPRSSSSEGRGACDSDEGEEEEQGNKFKGYEDQGGGVLLTNRAGSLGARRTRVQPGCWQSSGNIQELTSSRVRVRAGNRRQSAGAMSSNFEGWGPGDEGPWLPSDSVPWLRKMAKRLCAAGAGERCLAVYREVRATALLNSLKSIEIVELRVAALDAMPWGEMEGCLKAWVADLNIVAHILLGGEQRLCQLLFSGLRVDWKSSLSLLLLDSRLHRAIIMLCLNLQTLLRSRKSPEKVFWFLNILRQVEEVTPMFKEVLLGANKEKVLEEWAALDGSISEAVLDILGHLRKVLREPVAPASGPAAGHAGLLRHGNHSRERGAIFSIKRLFQNRASNSDSAFASSLQVDVSVHPVTSYVVNYVIKLMERGSVCYDRLEKMCERRLLRERALRLRSDREREEGAVAGARDMAPAEEQASFGVATGAGGGTGRPATERKGVRPRLGPSDAADVARSRSDRTRAPAASMGGGIPSSSKHPDVGADSRVQVTNSGALLVATQGKSTRPTIEKSNGVEALGEERHRAGSGSAGGVAGSSARQREHTSTPGDDAGLDLGTPEQGVQEEVSSVLCALEDNVAARARSLGCGQDAIGPSLFCINNAHCLLRCIDLLGRTEASKHLAWVRRMEADFEDTAIKKLAASLDHPNSSARKDSSEVKSRLRSFNTCFEELALDQRNWCILSDTYRRTLRARLAKKVADLYSTFLMPHKSMLSDMSTYRWTPDGVERTILRTFFLTAVPAGTSA